MARREADLLQDHDGTGPARGGHQQRQAAHGAQLLLLAALLQQAEQRGQAGSLLNLVLRACAL